jgi:hypothetical protein
MGTIVGQQGYLDNAYLDGGPYDYLSGQIQFAEGFQVRMQIVDETDDSFNGMQTEMFVNYDGDDPHVGMQVERITFAQPSTGFQIIGQIIDTDDDSNNGMQTEMIFEARADEFGMEVNIEFPQIVGHPKYLYGPEGYLSDSYLATKVCALLGMMVEMRRFQTTATGMQIDRKIVDDTDDPHVGMQTEMRVFNEIPSGMQIDRVKIERVGMQAALVLYNTDQLRFLCEFPSRGTDALGGNNWSSPQGTETGDFDESNVNTDVVEQRTQSPDGILNWELRCDTGAGNTFVDTIAILEHNMTTGAVVNFQASNDASFGTIVYNRTITIEQTNAYFILPLADFPPESARYYRFLISDTANPDNHIRIGTIVFGSSVIFSQNTTFDLPLSFGRQHFKDTIQTEGFTSVSNDRATRKFLGLQFSQIDVNTGDYTKLQQYFSDAKTDLKCLVIPYPCKPSLFAVWSKLSRLPEEQHNAIELCGDKEVHHVDLALDWDESL